MKNKIYLMLIAFIGLSISLEAQEDLQIKTSSGEVLMEVREDGVLLPKLTTAARTTNATTLGAADDGLMVYDTDTESFWLWNGSQWQAIGGGNPTDELQVLSINGDELSLSDGNSITLPGLQYLYKLRPVQERLDGGETVCNLLNDGIPIEALIGKNYQGGIIAYIEDPAFVSESNCNTRILIVVPEDIATEAEWGCLGTLTGSILSDVFEGSLGTSTILNACPENGIAARLASDYLGGGYTDWHLPSVLDLFEVIFNITADALLQEGVVYWSSSEIDENQAFGITRIGSTTGPTFEFLKDTPARVRPVRFVHE